MKKSLFDKILTTNYRVPRSVTYEDFNVDELKQVRELYLKKRYLNVAETAIMLGVCSHTVYRLIKRGKVVLRKDGAYTRPYLIDIKKTMNYIHIVF